MPSPTGLPRELEQHSSSWIKCSFMRGVLDMQGDISHSTSLSSKTRPMAATATPCRAEAFVMSEQAFGQS